MKKITYLAVITAILSILYHSGIGQEPKAVNPSNPNAGNTNNTIIPPSPTASSLGRYADIPISLYTGTPNISIPIWEVKGNKLSLPISLSYHSSGVKIEDIPGWVGQSWSLNCGGVVSRVVRGLPDESDVGYLTQGIPDKIVEMDADPHTKDYNYLRWLAEGNLDSEPDLFYFNISGYSGKFVLGNDKKIHTIPHQPLKIICPFNNPVDHFEIYTPDGTGYIFEEEERTQAWMHKARKLDYISSWYLTKIISHDKSDTIYLEYSHDNMQYNVSLSESVNCITGEHDFDCAGGLPPGGCGVINENFCVSTIYGRKLKSIISKNCKIVFMTGDRDDLVTGKKLDEILIYSFNNNTGTYEELKKKYVFSYSYFESTSNQSTIAERNYRLRLDSVAEIADGISKPPYIFEYNDTELPPRDSKAQDHWGYFNGSVNTTLIPELHYAGYEFEGADREPDGKAMLAGMLKTITYPTGGYTEFVFEPHTYNAGNSDILTVPISKQVVAEGTQHSSTYLNPDPENQAAKTFSVPEEIISGTARIEVHLPGLSDIEGYVTQHEYPRVRIKKLPTGQERVFLAQDDELNITENNHLSPGDYIIYAESYYSPDEPPCQEQYIARITVSWENKINDINYAKQNIAGGVRIKEIYHFDGKTTQVKKYEYSKEDDNSLSSGILLSNIPRYWYTIVNALPIDGIYNIDVCRFKECQKLVRQSNNVTSLGSSNGSSVGYSTVTEYLGANGETGKIVHTFSQYNDIAVCEYPFPPATSMDWARGMLLNKKVYGYDKDILEYKLQQEIINTYNDFETNEHNRYDTRGLKVGYLVRNKPCIERGTFIWIPFFIPTRWSFLSEVKERIYRGNDENNFLENTTNYYYENPSHCQVTKKVTFDSEGNEIITKYQYPDNYWFNDCESEFTTCQEDLETELNNLKVDLELCIANKKDECYTLCECPNLLDYLECVNDNDECTDDCEDEYLIALLINPLCIPYSTLVYFGCLISCDNTYDCIDEYNDSWDEYNDCMQTYAYGDVLATSCYYQYNAWVDAVNGNHQCEGNYETCINTEYGESDDDIKILADMHNRHIISPVIEKQTWIKKAGESESELLSSTFTKYEDFTQEKYLPENVLQIFTDSPLSDFTESHKNEDNNLVYDNRYENVETFDEYDDHGNILQHHRENDVNISYKWDYNSCLPVAKTVDAGMNEFSYFNYEDPNETGFPPGVYISDEFPYTGKYSLKFTSGSFKETSEYIPGNYLDNNSKYTLSGWGKTYLPQGTPNSEKPGVKLQIIYNNGGSSAWPFVDFEKSGEWEFFTMDLDMSGYPNLEGIWIYERNSVSGNTQTDKVFFDDIRFHPFNSQMTTLTYDPLFGITSRTDAANNIVYYEYDEFGRLDLVKDMDKNILQKTDYHYSDVEIADILILDMTTLDFRYNGGLRNINVTSKAGAWWYVKVEEGIDWLSIEDKDSDEFTISCEENTNASPRYSKVNVFTDEIVKTIYVNQDRSGYLEMVSGTEKEVSGGAGNTSFEFNTNYAWYCMSGEPDWLQATAYNPDNSDISFIIVVFDRNLLTSERDGDIYIKKVSDNSLVQTLTVNQNAGDYYIIFSAETLGVNSLEGNFIVNVESNINGWNVTEDEDWMFVVPPSAGNGNGSFKLHKQINNGSQKTGTVTVGNGSVLATITIIQSYLSWEMSYGNELNHCPGSHTFNTNVTAGTGSYTFKWFVDGQYRHTSSVGSESIFEIFLDEKEDIYEIMCQVDDGNSVECKYLTHDVFYNQSCYNLPTAGFDHEASPSNYKTINFEASFTGDNTTYEWDFGDDQQGTGQSPSHTYQQDGNYFVVLSVTKNTNTATSNPKHVGIQEPQSQPLSVDFIPVNIKRCEYHNFSASPEGGTGPYTYEWIVDGVSQSATENSFCHYFNSPNHDVECIVTDNKEAKESKMWIIGTIAGDQGCPGNCNE